MFYAYIDAGTYTHLTYVYINIKYVKKRTRYSADVFIYFWLICQSLMFQLFC